MVPMTDPTPGRATDITGGPRRGRQGRRRPSGEPPPLPREDRWTRWIWVLAAVLLLGAALNALIQTTDVVQRMDQTVLDWFTRFRTSALTDAAKVVALLTTFTAVMVLRVATVVVLVVYGRFRHLVVFLVTLVVTDWVVVRLLFVELPAPSVPVLADGGAYAFPSKSISTLAITLYAMPFVLAPRGRARNRLRAGVAAALVLVVLAELYLAGDYLVAMAYAAVLAPCVADVAFRWLVPEEGFPVTYGKRGNAAHLDLGGERGAAIVRAMADQLGLTVAEVKEFGLEGSGGSSPLRMTLLDGSRVFGKIYSTSHERADRWYRFGRTILYGQLEDETAVGSVRRLAAYEDYALRLLADHGVRVARTYGLVELTPNQEYMLVTEFFENARNLGDSQVDEQVIDEGPGHGAHVLGHRRGPPRHQAGQPPGPGGPPPVGGRLRARGPPLAVAPGGGPLQHAAHPGPAERPGAGLRPRHQGVHARRDRRGLRVGGRPHHPDRAADQDEGRPAPATRRVPEAGAAAGPDLDPALEHSAPAPHCRRGARHAPARGAVPGLAPGRPHLSTRRTNGTPAGYSQPLRRNPRYKPRQMSTITASTTG